MTKEWGLSDIIRRSYARNKNDAENYTVSLLRLTVKAITKGTREFDKGLPLSSNIVVFLFSPVHDNFLRLSCGMLNLQVYGLAAMDKVVCGVDGCCQYGHDGVAIHHCHGF